MHNTHVQYNNAHVQYNNAHVQYNNAHVQYNSSYCNNCPLIKNARNMTALYCEISQYGAQRNAQFLFFAQCFCKS